MHPEHLFLIDPLPSLNAALDSSLRMMFALAKRGHGIRVAETRELGWAGGQTTASVRCRRLTFGDGPVAYKTGPDERLGLEAFAGIHMRKDPPYDLEYVQATWLLDSAPRTTRIYNDSRALRRFNEKLAILLFPGDTKDALVSSDPGELERFVDEKANGDAILKPLTLFGGRGIERLEVRSMGRAGVQAKLREETQNGARMRLIQAFDPAIFAGEVRVFTAFGEPLAWCLKRPADGQFLANTRAGAKLEAYRPKKDEVDRVVRVARALLADGVALVGFDLIGGYLSEINITSPRLLEGEPGSDPYGTFADLVVADLTKVGR